MGKIGDWLKEFLKQSVHNQLIVVLLAVIYFGYNYMSKELDRKYESNSSLRKQLATNDSIYNNRITLLANDYQAKIDKCTEAQIKAITERAEADRQKYDELYQKSIRMYNKQKEIEKKVEQ